MLSDSVMKQLDGLKGASPPLGPAVRRFLGDTLEDCGTGGYNFLTVLAAHEGEGLLLERNATYAGTSLGFEFWMNFEFELELSHPGAVH